MRYLKIGLFGVLAILLLAAAAVIVLDFNASRLKVPLLEFMAERYGIDLAIDGEFSLRLLPEIRLVAADIRLLDGGVILNEAAVGRLFVRVPLSSLLRDTFRVSSLEVDSARVDVVTDLRNRLPARETLVDGSSLDLPIIIESVSLTNTVITLGEAAARLDGGFGVATGDQAYVSGLSIALEGGDLRQTLGLLGFENIPAGSFELRGSVTGSGTPLRLEDVEARVGDVAASGTGLVDLQGLKLQGTVTGENAEEFMHTWARLPVPPVKFAASGGLSYQYGSGELRVDEFTGSGGSSISFGVDGVIGRFIRQPFDFSPMALDVEVSGPDFAELFPQLTLPKEHIPYSGSLSVSRPGEATIVETSKAMLDDVPFEASLEYDATADVMFIANVHVAEVDLVALLTDPEDADPEDSTASDKPGIPAVPDAEVSLDFFLDKTFEIRVAADQVDIGRFKGRDLKSSVSRQGTVLRVDVEQLGFGDGVFQASASIDETTEIPTASIRAIGSNLRLESDHGPDDQRIERPLDNIDINLAGKGASLHAVLTSATGWIRADTGQGITHIGPVRQLLGVINPVHLDEDETRLTCAVGHFDVEDGALTARAVAIETDLLEVYATGGIDLNDESIDLRFRIGEHDGVSLAKIVSPLVRIGGTLSSPSVQLEPGNTAALILTEGWSLLINAFEQLSRADETICAASLRRAGITAVPAAR